MTPAELTGLIGVVASLLVSGVLPIYLVRRNDARQVRDRLVAAEAERAASAGLSWEAINKAIAKERDDLRVEIKELRAAWAREVAENHQQIRELSDEIDRLTDRLNRREGRGSYHGDDADSSSSDDDHSERGGRRGLGKP